MFKIIVILGLTLFALFFGAGNLIFPLKLGWESGSNFPLAITGFLITGVGIPLLGLIASSTSPGGIPGILKQKVSSWFSILLMIAIYLTIGPLFAIPRTATTSYTIGIVPGIGHDSSTYLLVFSIIYFAIVLILSLKPSKIVERVGQFLTPALIIVIALLCVMAFLKLNVSVTESKGPYLKNSAFTQGFTEGYLTMDAIASVAFSVISLNALRAMGIFEKNTILKYSTLAALVAGLCLTLVYLSLGWIGNHYPLSPTQLEWIAKNEIHEGAYILTSSANLLLSAIGPIVVSTVVTLACLTTAIGLTVAISSFFFNLLHTHFPSLKYSFYVYFFTIVSFILSNQGLNQVIKASVPVLTILYPIAILIIFLILLDQVISIPKSAFQITVGVTSLISISSILFPTTSNQVFKTVYQNIGISVNDLTFAWILPALIALIIGYCIAYIRKIH